MEKTKKRSAKRVTTPKLAVKKEAPVVKKVVGAVKKTVPAVKKAAPVGKKAAPVIVSAPVTRQIIGEAFYFARIRDKAYEIYADRACTHGNDLDDWYEAERLVKLELGLK